MFASTISVAAHRQSLPRSYASQTIAGVDPSCRFLLELFCSRTVCVAKKRRVLYRRYQFVTFHSLHCPPIVRCPDRFWLRLFVVKKSIRCFRVRPIFASLVDWRCRLFSLGNGYFLATPIQAGIFQVNICQFIGGSVFSEVICFSITIHYVKLFSNPRDPINDRYHSITTKNRRIYEYPL